MACASFDHPIDPLDSPQPGEVLVAQGAECGHGLVPANGSGFTVDPGPVWILYFAYTCDGTFERMGDAAVVFTAHNTASGADSPPVVQPGPWGRGAGGLTAGNPDVPPAGKYVIRVTVANPAAHKCQWRAAVYKR